MDAFYIILTGSFVAVTCGMLGCFLILRKMAMVGDAISHAVLPGIVIAFFIAGSRASLPMLIGAAGLGLFTTFLIELFHKRARLQTDAAIGLTFTFLFATGVIMISAFAGNVDLDQECVLYGEIGLIPLNTISIGALEIPRETAIMGISFSIISAFIFFCYKGLHITTFDPEFASAIGISTVLWHYLLMG
ncbi:MAG: metal ABC transporter permease, partial [Bacteroidota bacterium]|nr:metal ABC transporter permease [Bacteroidota bacterium]